MTPATRNDALRLELTGTEILSLRLAGSISGVVPLAASARNGPGVGLLTVAGGGLLTWQAPGSDTPGATCRCNADGVYMLEDGADPSAWLRIQVYQAWLPASGQSNIFLAELYGSIAPADVDASDASAGIVGTVEYALKNVSAYPATAVKLWIDPDASGYAALAVSSDGTNFYTPTTPTDSHVLAWASIAPGASANVWIKRTIGASSASTPGVLSGVQFTWKSIN